MAAGLFSKDDNNIQMYLDEINKIKVLTVEEEKELFNKVGLGDEKAREKLIESNLRLVVYVAKKFYIASGGTISFMDLIQEGNYVLLRAVDGFDVSQGNKFSSYLVKSIQNEYIKTSWHSSKLSISHSDFEKLYNIKKFEESYKKEKGKNPTYDEISIKLGYSKNKIIELKLYNQEFASLSESVHDNDGITLEEIIPDSVSLDEDVINKIFCKGLNEIVESVLTEREYTILKLRIEDKLTLEKICKIYGITNQRVRQIEQNAYKKIKKCLREKYSEIYEDIKKVNGHYL